MGVVIVPHSVSLTAENGMGHDHYTHSVSLTAENDVGAKSIKLTKIKLWTYKNF